MSFIRCLSNPEGMYVFGSTSGIEFYSGRGWHLSNIGPSEEDRRGMIVPPKTFYEACRLAEYVTVEDPVEVDGFRIEEVVIYTKTGRRVPERTSIPKNPFRKRADTMWAIKVSYKDKYVFMYRVTWDYIRNDAMATHRWTKKKSKRKT